MENKCSAVNASSKSRVYVKTKQFFNVILEEAVSMGERAFECEPIPLR